MISAEPREIILPVFYPPMVDISGLTQNPKRIRYYFDALGTSLRYSARIGKRV